MKIGDEVFVHGYVDEIRKDAVIIRNNGGYFGTTEDEVWPCAGFTGRWTHVYDENEKLFFRNKWVCSACGKSNTYGMSDFCPYCGARMENSTRRTKEAEN